jgi:GcrA cell cycle regulator
MEWNDEAIVRLRSLWNEGLSTAEIGRRMGVSKNAVVGKAHRLGLPARPSPIRRDGSGASTPRPAAPRRVVGPTLPPLAASLPTADEVRTELRTEARSAARAAAAEHAAAPVASAAPPVRVVPPRSSRLAACCWPIGEPGTKSFRFCDHDALTGKPYCAEHAQLAYVKVRDRREEAA